jgi:hypothetical protein
MTANRLPSESKEKAASKLRDGKLHYVSAVNSNFVYRSTSWMLFRPGIVPWVCIVSLPYVVLVLLSGGQQTRVGLTY